MAAKTERIAEAGSSFRLGDWLVEPRLNRISRGGAAVQVERKAMDILVHLAGRPGELVERRELLDAVWQTEFVSYNTIVGRIYELREALEDDARDPRYIETIPKRGYRLRVSWNRDRVAAVGTRQHLRDERENHAQVPDPDRSPG
jgi:DNA-binding winged helix-turn-helix (wHTH) protein